MMGRQTVDQSQLFYLFNLENCIPPNHLLRLRQSRPARYSRDHRSIAQDLKKGGFKTRPYKHPEP
jgi:hypothetical protein